MIYKFRTNNLIIQGDTHNTDITFKTLDRDIMNDCDYLHIGDGGWGFGSESYALDNAKSWAERLNKVCKNRNIKCYLIIGNHDNPVVWKLLPIHSNVKFVNSGDIGIFPNGKKALLVGGGVSIDRFTRTRGIDYWKDEITPYLEDIEECDVMFSHDCPEFFNHSTKSLSNSYGWYCDRDVNLIDDCLNQRNNMSDIAKRSGVTTIISGHFHNTICQEFDGVYYRCLDINELFDFDAKKEYRQFPV